MTNAQRWGQLTRTNAPQWGLRKGATDPPAEQVNNYRSKINEIYTICNSSNHFLTAKTITFSRTVRVLLSDISRSQVETIVQIFGKLYE